MNEHPSMDQLLLDKLNEAIENNLDNDQFGVPELADESGLSRSQLHRKLNSLTGQSASQMIREFRLKRALELLQDDSATVAEVSYLVGFGSPTYFNTCFSDFFGYNPGEVKLRKTTPGILRQSISKRNTIIQNMPDQSRQLAAIMFTDIVGYTALMGEDEQKAFELLKKNRSVQRPILEKFNGRWLKEIGDGVLASFPTATDAVYCAKEIQETCQNEPDLSLRIGIHLGEVVFEGNDVFGDGVNIASRLEPLAPVGGILVSESVHRNLGNKTNIVSTFLQEVQLKNVDEPIKVYQVQVVGVKPVFATETSTASQQAVTKFWNSRKMAFAIAGVLFILLLSYFLYSNFSTQQQLADTPQKQQLADVPPKVIDRSIAVFPFINRSDDPGQEALCDGLTEEIIHHLGRIKSFTKVIPPSSVMSLKNSNETMPEKAALLKVNTVLEGSFYQSGDSIKITVQLIDAVNNNQLWSEIYERPFGDIFDIESDIARNIAASVKAEITDEEEIRLNKKPTESSEAYILLKKGIYKSRWTNSPDYMAAIDLFKKAIETDPELAEAYTALANAYLWIDISFKGDKSIPTDDPLPLVQEALRLDPELAEGYRMLGVIKHWKEWNFSEAETAYKKALELDSQDLENQINYGVFLAQMGSASEALPYFENAFELEPTKPFGLISLARYNFYAGNKEKATEIMEEYESFFGNENPSGGVGLNYLYLNRLDKAIENLEKHNDIPLRMGFLAIAYTKNGQIQKAQPLVDRLKLISEKKAANDSEYSLGLYYSAIGQKEEALDWLERAYNSHDTELYFLKIEPMFKTLHGDPRYEKLLRKIGFPE